MHNALSCCALTVLLAASLTSGSGSTQVDTDQVRGIDLVAAVNLVKEDVKADGRLFLPDNVTRVRAVIVVTFWGLGPNVYADQRVRRLADTSDSALLLAKVTRISTTELDNRPVLSNAGQDAFLELLRRLAAESGHQELASAPLLFWGHSAAGNVGPAFTLSQPQRTIAFVLYQSAAMLSVRTDADIRAVSQVPALIIEGMTAPDVADASKNLWRRGRAAGAPWAFALQSDAPHGSEEYRIKANNLLIAWMNAVLRLRLSREGPRLRTINDDAAWLGLSEAGDIATSGTFAGAKAQSNWLPDEPSARAWRALISPAR